VSPAFLSFHLIVVNWPTVHVTDKQLSAGCDNMQYVIPTTAYPTPVTGLVSINPEYKRTHQHTRAHTPTHTHTESVTNHPNAVLMHKAVATGTPRVWGLTFPTTNKQLSATEWTNFRPSSRFASKGTTSTSVSILYNSSLHSSFLHFIRLCLSSSIS